MTPAQTTSSTADAATANDAGVEQTAGQTQLAERPSSRNRATRARADRTCSTGRAQGRSTGRRRRRRKAEPSREREGNGERGCSQPETITVRRNRIRQRRRERERVARRRAAARASGNAQSANAASGDQSANASARADVDRPANGNVTARIEAPGHNKDFDQTNEATAASDANASASGVDAEQQVSADACATLANPSNTAVELRVESDGDSRRRHAVEHCNGRRSRHERRSRRKSSATPTRPSTNPANTFVSVRVNSDGTTGDVDQHNTTSESGDGERRDRGRDHDRSRGRRVDVPPTRRAAWEVTLALRRREHRRPRRCRERLPPLPSSAPTFVWTWDMAFGPGAPVSCDISSSVTSEQVTWTFDCDPNDLDHAHGRNRAGLHGTITWTWSWIAPAVGLELGPRGRAADEPRRAIAATSSTSPDFVRADRSAHRSRNGAGRERDACRQPVERGVRECGRDGRRGRPAVPDPVREHPSDRTQSLLQEAEILQIVSAQASSQLTDALNESEVGRSRCPRSTACPRRPQNVRARCSRARRRRSSAPA